MAYWIAGAVAWVLCGLLSVWVVLHDDNVITLKDVMMGGFMALFGPITLFSVVADHGADIVIWRRK